MLRLDEAVLIDYLRGRGLLAPGEGGEVRRLTGGYINVVFRLLRDQPADDLIVKQSFEQSERTVLRADIERATVETQVLRGLKEWLGPDCPTPRVLDEDTINHAVVMSAAPREAVNYEDELQAGVVRPGVGQQIGEYLADLHRATAGRADVAIRFRRNPGFALRENSIRSAVPRNPDLALVVDEAFRRNRDDAQVLVDADLTPKNILVHGQGMTKLDFECAQWGHPALDVGVVLAHYLLHVVAAPTSAEALLAEAARCVEAYRTGHRDTSSPTFVRATADYTALMMIGRCDGELILDLIRSRRRFVNSAARWLLAEPVDTWAEIFAFMERIADLARGWAAPLRVVDR